MGFWFLRPGRLTGLFFCLLLVVSSGAEANASTISITPDRLIFGADTAGRVTDAQTFTVENSGLKAVSISAAGGGSWLSLSYQDCLVRGTVTISVDPSGLASGSYCAEISVFDPDSDLSPQTVEVRLEVHDQGRTEAPFGQFSTPMDGSTVRSSLPVTGWALDDIGLDSVKIYRDPVAGEGSEPLYIGQAYFVQGARPDVAALYPDYPQNSRTGWGYELLTNFLPNGGNGTYTLTAVATDKEGNSVTLGSKTIFCDNTNAVKPFGAIDTPAQGGTASGTSYINFGWALTPQPNAIPTEGSTIKVWLDGVMIGHPVYNQYRADIAALFPGYANSNGAMGYFYIDTTQYADGMHTISWTVTDNAGNSAAVGSRYFIISNDQTSNSPCDQGDGAL